jgi:4,5-dihydroxyphthalate decarboxylase
MTDLELTLTITPWDRVQPLLTGEVKPEGIRLIYTDFPLNEIWHRQLVDEEFDLSEMSFSYALKGVSSGWGYRLLPMFHNRTFSYVSTVVRVGSGIRIGHPEDLVGKRVGVTDYQQTASLWTHGIMRHEFGVNPAGVEWFQGRADPAIPGTGTFAPEDGVVIHEPPNDLTALMVSGDIDAMYTVHPPTQGPLADHTKFQPLFPDGVAESMRYFTKTGIFPTHHATVLRERIANEHPWAAKSLLEAFTEAQRIATERAYRQPPSSLVFARHVLDEQRAVFGDDPYAYGVEANAAPVDAVQTFAVELGTVARKLPLAELYAQGVET